jgi:DNA primase
MWETTAAQPGGSAVPGVDFGRVRALVTMEQVLSLLGFEPSGRSGSQWYGSCPLHESGPGRRRRSFSVNVALGRYCCHRCGSRGNQLELWAAATKLPLHQAAIDLCRRLGRDVPWIRRW